MDVVLTDLKMRRVGGLDVLREAHAVDPDIAVIMMTRFGSIASAVEAMRCGAYDYLTKPVNLHARGGRPAGGGSAGSERWLESCVGGWTSSTALKISSSSHASYLSYHRPGGRERRHHPARRGKRYGKELIARAIHTQQPPPAQTLHRPRLRRVLGGALGERAVRPRARRIYRRQRAEAWALRSGSGGVLLDEISEINPHHPGQLLQVLRLEEFLRVEGVEPVTFDPSAIISC